MMATADSGGRRQQVMIGVAVVVLVTAGVLAWRGAGGSSGYRLSTDRLFKCAECGHLFEHTLQIGDKVPFECPKCDRMAGYRAWPCYWVKGEEGEWKAKLEPTFVVLKNDLGLDEKTFCPDCGREVKGHDPKPSDELMDAARAEGGGG